MVEVHGHATSVPGSTVGARAPLVTSARVGAPDQDRQDAGTGPELAGGGVPATGWGSPDPGEPVPSDPVRPGGASGSEGAGDRAESAGWVETPGGSTSDAMTRRLLESLLAAQGGPASPRRWRVAAGVVRVLIAEGAAAEVASFLAPAPGRAATFELDIAETGPADGGRTSVQQFGPDVETAVREALRAATRGAAVRVRSVAGEVHRTVLRHSRTRPGSLELVPPGPDSYEGDGPGCRAAIEEWAQVQEEAALPGAAADGTGALGTGALGTGAGGTGADRPVPGDLPAGGTPTAQPAREVAALDLPAALSEAMTTLDVELDPAAISAAVQRALADVTIELDLTAVEQAVRSALSGLSLDLDLAAVEPAVRRVIAEEVVGLARREEVVGLARQSDLTALARRADLAALARGEDLAALARRDDLAPLAHDDQLADLARREDLANLARQGDIAGLARREDVADLARREDLADLARRGDIVGLGRPDDVVASADVARIESKLDQLLAAVALQGERPTAPGGPAAVAAEVATAELAALRSQVEILLQTVADRLAAGTRSMESLADELADRDRNAIVLAGELGRRIDTAVDRLAERLDRRPPGPSGAGPPAAGSLAAGPPAAGPPASGPPAAGPPAATAGPRSSGPRSSGPRAPDPQAPGPDAGPGVTPGGRPRRSGRRQAPPGSSG